MGLVGLEEIFSKLCHLAGLAPEQKARPVPALENTDRDRLDSFAEACSATTCGMNGSRKNFEATGNGDVGRYRPDWSGGSNLQIGGFYKRVCQERLTESSLKFPVMATDMPRTSERIGWVCKVRPGRWGWSHFEGVVNLRSVGIALGFGLHAFKNRRRFHRIIPGVPRHLHGACKRWQGPTPFPTW